MLKDPWFTVTEIAEDTYAISEYGHWEQVHSFLLIGQERAALIDTGMGIGSMKGIIDQLTTKPIIVVTTHVHTDHIGSHGEFDELAVHEKDVDWLENGIEGLTLARIRHDVARDITKPTPATFIPEKYTPFTGKVSLILHDGDEVDLGERRLSIIHTPGHSPGHIVILDKKERLLFTGDLLYDTTPVYAFYPSTSPQNLTASLKKISQLENITQVFGSHNTLGLPPSILKEAGEAADYLIAEELDTFGTGIHQFEHFSVQF